MAGYQQRNNTVIQKAFDRFTVSSQKVIERGMIDLLENAMLFAIGEHDFKHWLHKSTANSYGWALLHDGVVIANKVNDGRHGDGSALSDLMLVSKQVPQIGWVGILLASLHGDRPMFFAVTYEISLLGRTVIHTLDNFNRYFRPIAV